MKKKHLITLLTTSVIASIPLSFVSIPKNVQQCSADFFHEFVFIAVDADDNIGYISEDIKDFYSSECNYYMQVNMTDPSESNIFSKAIGDTYEDDIKKVIILDTIKIINCSFLFYDLPNLETIEDIDKLDTSESKRFDYMFAECPNLTNVDFSHFSTSIACSFSNMFNSTGFETLDLSNFDTSDVGDFRRMFEDCERLTSINLSSFDTSNARYMEYMFSGCDSLSMLDLSSFDFSNCLNMEGFFRYTNLDIIIGPKNVPDTPFHLDFFLQQYSEEKLFFYDEKLIPYTYVQPTDKSVTYYSQNIFKEVNNFAQSFYHLFSRAEEESWTVDDLRSAWETFIQLVNGYESEYKDYSLKILKACDNTTPHEVVTNAINLYDCIYTNYYGALFNNGGDFLNRCPKAGDKDGYIHIGVNTNTQTGYLASFDTYEILSSNMRWKIKIEETSYINSVFSSNSYMEYEDIKQVIIQDEITINDGSNLFKGLSSTTSISNLEYLDTSLSESFESMFEDCANLESIDLDGIDGTNVKNVSKMFKNCENLTSINLNIDNANNLSRIDEMFYGCSSLIAIDLSNMNFENVTIAMDFLYGTSFFYLVTPELMPTGSCDINLYVPIGEQNYYFYDSSFNTYQVLPKNKDSFVIISEQAKRLLGNFCNSFAKDCDFYCSSDGTTSETKLISLWENQSQNFTNHIKNTVHSYLLEFFKQDNSSCTFEPLRDFSNRYDYIYGKYQPLLDDHGGDFAFRTSFITFSRAGFSTGDSLKQINNIFYIAIPLITLSFITLFVITKKKRA